VSSSRLPSIKIPLVKSIGASSHLRWVILLNSLNKLLSDSIEALMASLVMVSVANLARKAVPPEVS